MKKQPAYQLTLSFDNMMTVEKVRKIRSAERSKDSSGRYVSEIEIPTHEEFEETERRRQKSLSNIIRLQAEEIIRLKEIIQKYRENG